MSYFVFIHGKNPILSLAEIVSYLETNGFCHKLVEYRNSFSVFEIDKEPDINKLGGTIKIGKVLVEGSSKDVDEK
ncbi:MAG: hypothetical protein DRP15_03705, partial [Candidatus Aenigmatarchaeota archaeon]